MRKAFTAALGALLTASGISSAGPYPGAAGTSNTTAIAADDPRFVAWADGWTDYQPGPEVAPQWRNPEEALGAPEGDITSIVSLGRGGSITLTFPVPIADGPGWDFAIFENAFNDTFLELAYVEVSSDGIHFFRIANSSLTPGLVPQYGAVDPTDVDGLAGKYRAGYGTPFDLGELRDCSPWLDVSAVTHVRLVDVVGDGSCTDSFGHPIYDPYPTTNSAGFDLDGAGIINSAERPQIFRSSDGICLRWYAVSGRFYRVQYCDDPLGGRWSDLGPELLGGGAERTVMDTNSSLSRVRFYRIIHHD